MKNRSVLAILTLLLAGSVRADSLPLVSPMFGDNMVLQRDKTNVIWGWAKPGESIQVALGGQTASAVTKPDGAWQARLLPPNSRNSLTMEIRGPQTVVFTNILVGDVWLCGGQSNMEFPLSRARNGDAEVKAANRSNLRLLTIKPHAAYVPATIAQGGWKLCTPQTVTEDGGVSAVGYFFARKIQRETNVPIALIKDCWGGTPAESWASVEALKPFQEFDAQLAEIARLHARGGPEYGNFISHWYDEFDGGQKNGWFAAGLDDSDWQTVTIPGGFRELGVPDTPAVCYFRKSVVLPTVLPAGPAKICLGIVERMDTVQINGHWVGASAWVENPRVYPIGEGILKPGTNVVVIRVFKTKPEGGFESKPDDLKLELGDQTEIPLAGEWKGKLSVDARPPQPLPLGFENWPTMPAVLYNGMIAPVAPFAIRGVIWYQGEANAGRATQYQKLLPAMIADWRRVFAQGDFPFYLVSLAAFMPHKLSPGNDSWAELREAQAMTAGTVTNSGLAITIDVGNANDIHPIDKKTVGDRLAAWALAKNYGRNVPYSGPTFKRTEEIAGALKLDFDHTDGGLMVKGGKLGEFSVAGADGIWFWAEAKIEGDSVIVWSSSVPHPKYARYAWQANPRATLFNGAGFPAVPFRTDPAH